jgi:hypothetical protein
MLPKQRASRLMNAGSNDFMQHLQSRPGRKALTQGGSEWHNRPVPFHGGQNEKEDWHLLLSEAVANQ